MKYKMRLSKEYGANVIYLLSESGLDCLWIYNTGIRGYKDSEGFWYSPDWYGSSLQAEINQEYHKHRDEYITEAKKILVKEML